MNDKYQNYAKFMILFRFSADRAESKSGLALLHTIHIIHILVHAFLMYSIPTAIAMRIERVKIVLKLKENTSMWSVGVFYFIF